MKNILISLIFIFLLTGCALSSPKISNLSEFKGCTVKSVSVWQRGKYTNFTAYCNGKFKEGTIPLRVSKIETIQNLIDSVKIAEEK